MLGTQLDPEPGSPSQTLAVVLSLCRASFSFEGSCGRGDTLTSAPRHPRHDGSEGGVEPRSPHGPSRSSSASSLWRWPSP